VWTGINYRIFCALSSAFCDQIDEKRKLCDIKLLLVCTLWALDMKNTNWYEEEYTGFQFFLPGMYCVPVWDIPIIIYTHYSMKYFFQGLLIVLCSLVLQHPLQAAEDDVLTTINQAIKQYNNGDFAGAASNLDYAAQLVRQKKSEKMKELLPEPLAGWKAGEASSQAMGTAVFGGGVTVGREYTKASSSINVEIISDSPVLQSVLMMLNNPMFAGAGGGNLKTIKGQRAIIKYNGTNRSGDINIVVAGRFMVTIKGNHVEQDDLVAYAEAIDYQELTKY